MKNLSISGIPGLQYILAVCIITLTGPSMNDDFLPQQLGPWSLSSDTLYTPENLYDYIDGGAELYLSYGFREVKNRTYAAGGQPDITVDVFDMNRSEDAYGVFMYSAEEVSGLVGQGTQYNEGFMLFWMDHYFISIMSYPETSESREAILELARIIEKKIGKKGPLPGILRYLPEEGLEQTSIRYFHHYAWLNSYYYVSAENILGIEDDTDAVLARYKGKDRSSILLIIEYPTGEKAGAAYGEFTRNFLPELKGRRSLQIEDGTYAGIEKTDPFLVLVFNASSDTAIDELIGRVRKIILSEQP